MEKKKVQLNLYILEFYRDMLQRIAGERMLKNPKRSSSASKIGAEILCTYLNGLEKKEKSSNEITRGKESQ